MQRWDTRGCEEGCPDHPRRVLTVHLEPWERQIPPVLGTLAKWTLSRALRKLEQVWVKTDHRPSTADTKLQNCHRSQIQSPKENERESHRRIFSAEFASWPLWNYYVLLGVPVHPCAVNHIWKVKRVDTEPRKGDGNDDHPHQHRTQTDKLEQTRCKLCNHQ